MRKLAGKVVVITGAAGGIGSALARAFADRGATLALADLDGEGLDARRRDAPALASATTHALDVREPEAWARVRREILEAHGRVDVLVNNAGVTTFGDFASLDDVEIERVIAINFRGVVYGCRCFAADLRARPEAHIVNLSSEAGLAGMPWQSIYCATKFAVRGFSSSLRAELAGVGIGVTCVLPGATATPILASAPSTMPATSQKLGEMLSKHAKSPDKVARAIVRAVRRNKAELFTGADSWGLDWGVRFAPGLVRFAMRRVAAEAWRRHAREGEAPADD